jgi:hypothetical protein
MLDPWVIEQIRRREEERRRDDRARIEIPVPSPLHEDEGDSALPAKERTERGVTVIDL